jgi:hypothetical protein
MTKATEENPRRRRRRRRNPSEENAAEENPRRRRRRGRGRRRGRRRNPKNDHSALGALVGSTAGSLPGLAFQYGLIDAPTMFDLLDSQPVAFMTRNLGSVLGGGVGGYVGAKGERKARATLGGLLGGVIGPLGAAAGAYAATRTRNEWRTVKPYLAIAGGIAGTIALAMAPARLGLVPANVPEIEEVP